MGALLKDYVYMGNRLIAENDHVGSRYLYYTPDQINSTRIVTDSTGTVVYSAAHDPYGGIQKTWVNTFDPKRKFSDKERDGETGLDYFGARYFNSLRYRFLNVDPIFNKAGRLAIPQLLNLYAYCRNNPMTYLDPYGLECYVFYDPSNFSGQALAEQRRLKEKYPNQEVILVSITSEAEFKEKWASMVDPVEVTLIFHSGSGDNSMTVVSIRAENYEYLTAHPSGRTPPGASATYIGELDKKKFKELNLYICHAGDSQVLNNVAEVFFKTQDIERVKASPGFVNFNNPYISTRVSVLGFYLPAYAPKDSTSWIYKERVP